MRSRIHSHLISISCRLRLSSNYFNHDDMSYAILLSKLGFSYDFPTLELPYLRLMSNSDSYFTVACYTIIWQVMSYAASSELTRHSISLMRATWPVIRRGMSSTASSRASIINSRAHMFWAHLSCLRSSLTWTCTFKQHPKTGNLVFLLFIRFLPNELKWSTQTTL